MAKTINNEDLDADELLHLAILASNQAKHEESISLLKRAQNKAPKQGNIHYLLGAEHAQIGLYDRAAEEMTKAIELDPNLHTASFQLGLLHMTSGRVDEATKAWSHLDSLGQKNPLYLFKTGLMHLARDEFEPSMDNLRKGIQLNKTNDALNRDMLRVLGDVEKLVGAAKANATPAKEQPKQDGAANHVLLSAYRKNRDDEGE
jgi:tetratricopeptide (TPR) repeat protein